MQGKLVNLVDKNGGFVPGAKVEVILKEGTFSATILIAGLLQYSQYCCSLFRYITTNVAKGTRIECIESQNKREKETEKDMSDMVKEKEAITHGEDDVVVQDKYGQAVDTVAMMGGSENESGDKHEDHSAEKENDQMDVTEEVDDVRKEVVADEGKSNTDKADKSSEKTQKPKGALIMSD